jgi:subtilisin family serine protease
LNDPEILGLLIRVPAGARPALSIAATATLGLRAGAFELEPLFSVEAAGGSEAKLGTAPGGGCEWHVARLKDGDANVNPWDLAHGVAVSGRGIAGGEIFVEPDLQQEWPYLNPGIRGEFPLAVDGACTFNDQLEGLPRVPGRFAWHLEDARSQLREAREIAGIPTDGGRIRIGHLDTGFDPNHASLPRHVRQDLQRNFVDGQPENDAHDPAVRGTLQNPGHGTGTLGILAGNRVELRAPGYATFADFLGGAPEAEIVPLRVGTSVVQLKTSSVAAAISYATELGHDGSTAVHVLSMSMGGVASQAWADAVNKAYEAGLVFVAAAGNNFSAGLFGLPTRLIVYPARFRRVIAACGVMADGRPYFGLPVGTMQGNWGPASKMATALAAFTPNMPWAELGCSGIVDMDGSGTSSATPQIAAAAALYLQKHAAQLFDRSRYPELWMRAEAVRQALFAGASRAAGAGSTEKLGNGILQAANSLAQAPLPANQLRAPQRDGASLAFLNVFTGFGIATSEAINRMLALEATQLAQQWPRDDLPNPFDRVSVDPDLPPESVSPVDQRLLLEALRDHPRASNALRQRLGEMLKANTGVQPVKGGKQRRGRRGSSPLTSPAQAPAETPSILPKRPFSPLEPPHRRLWGFAIDPSLSTTLKTAPISRIVFKVPWEPLAPGPVGEYLEVIDVDPGSGCTYQPVDLELPTLLAQDGIEPSEGTPQFHQQMVYAVASLTISNFERALGRRTLWRPGPSPDPKQPKIDSRFVPRLRVYPHALRERNAYYSPAKIALLFGYFRAVEDAPGEHMAGGMVFTALSHDIIAHETAHALLDGMNRSFLSPTNPDVHAFHEAFSDIVALFQHFTFPDILRHQISATRGYIRSQESLLGELAGEFGRGTGLRGALRQAIGRMENGEWKAHKPDPEEYRTTLKPHDRGAILVAAVFDAFLSIYESRTADLLRLASNGTGILEPGAIHPDLVNRLADEAAKSAQHVLTMCIRALDYCPIVDITFGEYLRAIITADYDLLPDDDLNYRVAFIEAFRKRGLYPRDVRTLSVESLLWQGPTGEEQCPSPHLEAGLANLRSFVDQHAYSDSRERLFHLQRDMRRSIHGWLREHFAKGNGGVTDAAYLGLDATAGFEVRTARLAFRTSPDGGMLPQLIVSMQQRRALGGAGNQMFEGGCTVIADLRNRRIKYCIRKNVMSESRMERQRAFAIQSRETLRAVYFSSLDAQDETREPFAIMHRGC